MIIKLQRSLPRLSLVRIDLAGSGTNHIIMKAYTMATRNLVLQNCVCQYMSVCIEHMKKGDRERLCCIIDDQHQTDTDAIDDHYQDQLTTLA